MITIKNVRNLRGEIETLSMASDQDEIIDVAGSWTLLPAAIDTAPKLIVDWNAEAKNSLVAGITTFFELGVIKEEKFLGRNIQAKCEEAQNHLNGIKIPMHCHFYYELGPQDLEELGKYKSKIKSLKFPDHESLEGAYADRLFQISAQEDCLLTFTADPNQLIRTHQAIDLAQKYSTQLLIVNITNSHEINLLNEARASEVLIHSAVKASSLQACNALWEGIHSKIIDLVTSDWSQEAKIIFPILINGFREKKISMEEIVAVTRSNAEKIFRLEYNKDVVLVDLKNEKKAENSKGNKGWIKYTILNGIAYPSCD